MSDFKKIKSFLDNFGALLVRKSRQVDNEELLELIEAYGEAQTSFKRAERLLALSSPGRQWRCRDCGSSQLYLTGGDAPGPPPPPDDDDDDDPPIPSPPELPE